MTVERLQKILARAGAGSRRACEELIAAGRVTVNGRTAALGSSADAGSDDIRLDGERIRPRQALVYVALNKPIGVVSSLQAQGARRTVRDLVDMPGRLYPAGRLDVDSEGLVLLTNDGETALRLTHPRYGHEKEYRVLVDRLPDEAQLDAWRRGVVLADGTRTLPTGVEIEKRSGRGAWLRLVMRQGRKRQIRETAQALGLRVERLVRTRIDGIRLTGLKPGEWRALTPAEVTQLSNSVAGRPRASTPRKQVGRFRAPGANPAKRSTTRGSRDRRRLHGNR